jgi:hypothetical protein
MKQYRNKKTNEIVKATELTKTFKIVWTFGEETIYKFINKEEFLKEYEEWEK